MYNTLNELFSFQLDTSIIIIHCTQWYPGSDLERAEWAAPHFCNRLTVNTETCTRNG